MSKPIDAWVVRLANDGNRWTKRRQIEKSFADKNFKLRTFYKNKADADLAANQATALAKLEFIVVECVL